MSWEDYGITGHISPNTPIKIKELEALRLAILERLVACNINLYILQEDGDPIHKWLFTNPKYLNKDIYDSINFLIWDFFPNYFCYWNANILNWYNSVSLTAIVGSRINLSYPSYKWFNQVIQILNLYKSRGVALVDSNSRWIWSTFTDLLYDDTWEDAVQKVENDEMEARPGWYPFRNLYTGYHTDMGLGYINRYIDISFGWFYLNTITYVSLFSYLTANRNIYFYCYHESGTVFQPLNGMVENQHRLWKNYGNASIFDDFYQFLVNKEEVISGNTFIEPPLDGRTQCLVDLNRPTLIYENISFDFHEF